MDTKLNILMITLAIASVALMPAIMMSTQSVDAKGWCESQKGKPQAWITGCKDGWYDHDHCLAYNPHDKNSDYKKGYEVGWNIGSC